MLATYYDSCYNSIYMKTYDALNLNTSVQYLKGVGSKKAVLLEKLNIFTIQDMLYFFPRDYEDRSKFEKISNLKPNNIYTLKVNVISVSERTVRKNLSLLSLKVTDNTGFLSVIFFNQKYLKKYFKPGVECLLSGKVDYNRGIQMTTPSYEFLYGGNEDLLHTGRIVPVYNLTYGITQRMLRNYIKNALDLYINEIKEVINQELINKYKFLDKKNAILNIHFPQNNDVCLSARQRLIFEEFFVLQTGIVIKKKTEEREVNSEQLTVNSGGSAKQGDKKTKTNFALEGQNNEHKASSKELPNIIAQRRSPVEKQNNLMEFEEMLSFELTNAQKNVIKEISSDMCSDKVMHRLLQGDVGSGKTIVAVYALLLAVRNGYQGVLMAPTEILAEQHYLVIKKMLDKLGIKSVLVVGGQKKRIKSDTADFLRAGAYHVVIGTHALLEDWVCFKNLGLVVIDEQHKFGVMQRAKLKNKGINPDILIMTATPIPRTLTMTVYGDLDVSIIDELPGGRKPIKTFMINENKKTRLYNFVKDQVKEGRQIYFVYPLVEESEKMDLKAAITFAEHLSSDIFPELNVLLMHGRMSGSKKDEIMTSFKNKEAEILVATTVIEVGVDVANASVMVIENAERFGLAQLHQIRGRVGRSEYQSYCILVTTPKTAEAKKRMQVMCETCNGFKIAEEDLEIRGPGEFFGLKQHGIPELRIGSLIQDIKVMERARDEAFNIINNWNIYSKDETVLNLIKYVKERYQDKIDFAGIG